MLGPFTPQDQLLEVFDMTTQAKDIVTPHQVLRRHHLTTQPLLHSIKVWDRKDL